MQWESTPHKWSSCGSLSGFTLLNFTRNSSDNCWRRTSPLDRGRGLLLVIAIATCCTQNKHIHHLLLVTLNSCHCNFLHTKWTHVWCIDGCMKWPHLNYHGIGATSFQASLERKGSIPNTENLPVSGVCSKVFCRNNRSTELGLFLHFPNTISFGQNRTHFWWISGNCWGYSSHIHTLLWVVELLGAEKMDNDRSNISSSASCFLSCWAYICFQKKMYKCPKHQCGLGFRVPHYELLCILRVRRTSKLSAPHVLENPKAHIKVHKTGIKLASSSSLPLTSDQVPQSSNGHCTMSFVSLFDCLKEEVWNPHPEPWGLHRVAWEKPPPLLYYHLLSLQSPAQIICCHQKPHTSISLLHMLVILRDALKLRDQLPKRKTMNKDEWNIKNPVLQNMDLVAWFSPPDLWVQRCQNPFEKFPPQLCITSCNCL